MIYILKDLFKPKNNLPKVSRFIIGKQNVIMIDISTYNGKIIFDKLIKYLFLNVENLYWFINENYMYEDLTELTNYTDEDVFVLIG